MTRVVLASASTGRLRVLRGAGIDPLVVVSGVDEDAVVAALPQGSGPAAVTTALAAAKADAVVAELPPEVSADAVVIGCDSMLERDGRLWGKPGTAEAVRAAWRAMAGRAGTLYTGHSVLRLRDGATLARCDEHSATTVRFGEPTEADVAAYAETGEPQGVAGAFTLDGRGGWFVEGIDGDPSAVIGLSLPMLRDMLGRCGLTVADLWRDNPTPPD